ncbi:MAG: roadblock/LC7 domain-containing protein [Deinococcales bacterium]
MKAALNVHEDVAEQLEQHLQNLLKKSRARYAMICDRQGFVMHFNSALWADPPPSIDALASLIVSTYAASDALAKLLGEANFSESIQQGKHIAAYTEYINEELLLSTIFDGQGSLGQIKLLSHRTIKRITPLLENLKPLRFNLDKEWSQLTTLMLDHLFKDPQ